MCLYGIDHYIKARRETVAAYIRDRPIFSLCVEAERRRGTSPRQYWWDQEMSLDDASEADEASVVAEEETDND